MAKLYKDDPGVRFLIRVVRDKNILYRALAGVEFVDSKNYSTCCPRSTYTS